MSAAPGAVRPISSPPMRMISKSFQGSHPTAGDQPDIASAATVATVWASAIHVRLPPKGNAAAATVATPNAKRALVYETAHFNSCGYCAEVCAVQQRPSSNAIRRHQASSETPPAPATETNTQIRRKLVALQTHL